MTTDIELVSKALADFDAVAAGLAALRTKYAGVVYNVVTTAGMDEAKAARLELREPRYEVERIRKAAKAPILALGKKLDADAARITTEIEKLEKPIDDQIKSEENRKEAEKQAKIAAEVARVTAIQAQIEGIRRVVSLPFSSAANVLEHIADVTAITIDESFAEFQQNAEDAKAASLARLREIHAAFIEREAEQARIVTERAELERLRAEQAERDRIERQRIAEEQAASKAAMDRANAIAAESVRKQKEINDAANLAERAAAAKIADELARQRAVLADQEREQQARMRAEREKLDAERAELERQKVATAPPPPTIGRPSEQEIIAVVAKHFGVSEETAYSWLAEIALAA